MTENRHTDPLQAYDSHYLDCRGLAHTWRDLGFFEDGGFVSRLTQCTRCHTRKIQTLRRNGDIVEVRYQYPDGYSLAGQEAPIVKRDIRRETIRRATVHSAKSMDDLLGDL